MGSGIRFNISMEKAIEAVVLLAHRKPDIDIYHVAKIVFLAEKDHLNRYARSILGDRIKKLDNGPAPSMVLDIINLNDFLSPRNREKIQGAIEVNWNYPKRIKALREPNMGYFSGTDLDCLIGALDKYGEWSFDALFDLTHSMKCYSETMHNDYIDYELLIDEDNPYHDEIINHLKETASCVQL